jgi:hypothetical protein
MRAVIFALLYTSACAANVQTRRTEYFGHLDGGDEDYVYMTTEDGRLLAIPRDDIKEIGHPARHLELASNIMGLAWVANFLLGNPLCGRSDDRSFDAFCPVLSIYTGAAVTISIISLVARITTRSTLREPPPYPGDYEEPLVKKKRRPKRDDDEDERDEPAAPRAPEPAPEKPREVEPAPASSGPEIDI